MSTSDRLTRAFRALRRDGYFARKNFMCCQSCGWAAIPVDANAVFYHAQDADQLQETGQVYLAWAGNGAHIVERLKAQGLNVVWDGSADTRILCSERGLQ